MILAQFMAVFKCSLIVFKDFCWWKIFFKWAWPQAVSGPFICSLAKIDILMVLCLYTNRQWHHTTNRMTLRQKQYLCYLGLFASPQVHYRVTLAFIEMKKRSSSCWCYKSCFGGNLDSPKIKKSKKVFFWWLNLH